MRCRLRTVASRNATGKYVCIWAKQADGTWKAIHDIWNTDSK
jgi:ketosteroid isomerase-like protein